MTRERDYRSEFDFIVEFVEAIRFNPNVLHNDPYYFEIYSLMNDTKTIKRFARFFPEDGLRGYRNFNGSTLPGIHIWHDANYTYFKVVSNEEASYKDLLNAVCVLAVRDKMSREIAV